jgi:uncharacterized membrane protein
MTDWLTEYRADLIGVFASAMLLVGYNLYLAYKLRHNPHYTMKALNRAARSAWISAIMKDEARTIIAIQTLRNSTMAATFLASTAVLLIMGTLTLTGQASNLAQSWHTLNIVGSAHRGLWMIKLLALVIDFFVAFFSFSLATRMFNHVGYQVAVPTPQRPASLTPRVVGINLNRAGRYYSLGMRAYYYSVPMVFWLFGPHWMMLATAALIFVLFHIDRAPGEH